MSRRKRWILLAVGAVFALGWLLWWWFLAWDANTLAQWLAETSAMEHARENHPEYAMELCGSSYGIERPGCFEVHLECPDNEDVSYFVYTTQFGRFVDDDFTRMVTNRGATLKRMEAELERNCNLWDLFSDQADHFYWSPELTFLPGYWDEEWRSKLTLNLPLDI